MLTSQMISHQVHYVTRQLVRKTRFTPERVREFKNGRNSVTVQIRTHDYINFFDTQRPRKSPPAVMSTSRETPCIYSTNIRTEYFKHAA
jgi:hypothetical protein